MNRPTLLRSCFVLSLLVSSACAEDPGSTTDFATSSWSKPVHHGELTFGGLNAAEITKSQPFHGWSFTLTGAADVTLTTSTTENVDTVLYLYKATADGKKTGKYLTVNDDAKGAITSEVKRKLDAGSYFVQIKAKKSAIVGDFALHGVCTGAGCPVVSAPSLDSYCEGADEAFGKCMDDSLDATEEECAPSGAEAMLCCNGRDEWYCEAVCDPANLGLATVWNEDLDPVFDVFPEHEFGGLQSAISFAVASCGNPELERLSTLVLEADDLVEDPADAWQVDGWVMASDPKFPGSTLPPEVVEVVDGIVGAKATAHWSATIEVPCPNCTDGFAKDVLYYEEIGKLIVLESRWGGDS
jgi:hypothetical protein